MVSAQCYFKANFRSFPSTYTLQFITAAFPEVLTFHSLVSDRGKWCLSLSVLAVLEKEWSSIFDEGN